MEIKILHLYYDIMSLYGEYANLETLKRRLEAQNNVTVTVDKATVGDTAELSAYDLIYIGSGTEKGELRVLSDAMKYRNAFCSFKNEGKIILATGNGFELFGKSVTCADGTSHEALGLFDYETYLTDKKRTTVDQICTTELLDRDVVGFINRASEIRNVRSPLFRVRYGVGNSDGDCFEGVGEGNFFGTHITGPVLMKNPHFADLIASVICKNAGTEYMPAVSEYEQKAYEITLKALEERFEDK